MEGLGLSVQGETLFGTKSAKDGGPDGRGVGFDYLQRDGASSCSEFSGFTACARSAPGRATGQHYSKPASRSIASKPDELYDIIEACSPGPFSGAIRTRVGDRAGHNGATSLIHI